MSLRHEFESIIADQQQGMAPSTSCSGVRLEAPASADAWLSREVARGQEQKRLRRREKLQRKLDAAESYQKVGRWGSFALGVVWLLTILAALIHGVFAWGLRDPVPIFVSAWLILPVSAFAYLVGALRRALVLTAARRYGIELQVRRPVVRRWIVVEEPAQTEAGRLNPSRPASDEVSTAGAQLDASLAADRHQRHQRERGMQRKLDGACRFEHRGRGACLASAMGSIFFWATLITSEGAELPQGPARVVMIACGLLGIAGLSLGALTVLGAKLRQGWLRKQARAQAIEVARVSG